MNRIIALAAAAILSTMPLAAANAHEVKAGDLVIDHPWIRATPPAAKVAGGYVTIVNRGSAPDRLVGGAMAQAERTEIHEMRMDEGVMKMRPVAGGLEIAPGATLELKPGSYHLMFMGLKSALKEGETVAGSLVFEKAGEVALDYVVEGMGGPAKDGMKMEHGGQMKHD